MNVYTPTTEEIAGWWAHKGGSTASPYYASKLTKRAKEFDRWLTAHDATKRAEWEAEQGDKPAPCVMTHTPPFNFAQCETHDETFPLGGACKWYGKESIYEVLEDETDEQRMRAVRAEQQLEILRAEQGETWEYCIAYPSGDKWNTGGVEPFKAEQDAWDDLEKGEYLTSDRVVRRRKAGPWLPVPGSTVRESDSGVRDSDNEESEGE